MLRKRIFAGVSSNLILQAISACIQIFGVPLCLVYWGDKYYGEWLLLFTIPGYLGVSDFGLGTSSAAEMSMMAEDHRRDGIQSLLKSVFWFILVLGSIPFGLLLASNYFLPWYEWLKLSNISLDEFKVTFPLLVLYIYVSIFLTIPLNYYRVIKKYHIERYISAGYKLCEFIILFFFVIGGMGVLYVAMGYFLLRICFFLFIIFDLYRRSEMFRLWPAHIHFNEVRKVLKPGISGLFFNLGGNLLNQGLSTMIGLNFGPQKLVMFNTIRTLINVSKQVINIFNLSIYAEFSYAFGSKNIQLLRKLLSTSLLINIIFSGMLCLGLWFTGSYLISWWTGGIVSVDKMFFGFYLIYAFLGSISSLAITALAATNAYKHTGLIYLILISVCISIIALWIDVYGLTYAVLSLILFEIIFILVSYKVVFGIMETGWNRFIQEFSFIDFIRLTVKQ